MGAAQVRIAQMGHDQQAAAPLVGQTLHGFGANRPDDAGPFGVRPGDEGVERLFGLQHPLIAEEDEGAQYQYGQIQHARVRQVANGKMF